MPYVVTLGTTGGPRWRTSADGDERVGISTAVVVGDWFYLVDCGHGTGRQLKRAGLDLNRLRGIFITHLHSDHIADLSAILLFTLFERDAAGAPPVILMGPPSRGKLPPISHERPTPAIVAANAPTPGTADMFHLLTQAFATDFNDRILDTAARSPLEHFSARDIKIPAGLNFDPDTNHSPRMTPFEVHVDEDVRVTATLVSHPPMAPAFGFRFDTSRGSVTISGDTAPSENLVHLASGTDLLLHEAIAIDLIADRSPATELAAASIAHHRRAHTSPRQAGEIAQRAGARQLGLHHLVPVDAPQEEWLAAGDAFEGTLYIPRDLDTISFAADGSSTAMEPQLVPVEA
jgi:ribonuclease BN (tRNA processing enzyme)